MSDEQGASKRAKLGSDVSSAAQMADDVHDAALEQDSDSEDMEVDHAVNDSGIALDDLPTGKHVQELFASTVAALPTARAEDTFRQTYSDSSPRHAPNPFLITAKGRAIGLPFSSQEAKWLSTGFKASSTLCERVVEVEAHNPAWYKWLEGTESEVAEAFGITAPIKASLRGAVVLNPSTRSQHIQESSSKKVFAQMVVALPSLYSNASMEVNGADLQASMALGGGLSNSFDTTVVAWFCAGTEATFECSADDKAQLLLLFDLCLQDADLPVPVSSRWTQHVQTMRACLQSWKLAYETADGPRRICHYLESVEGATMAELEGPTAVKVQLLQEAARAEGFRLHFFNVRALVTGRMKTFGCPLPSMSYGCPHRGCPHHDFYAADDTKVAFDITQADSDCKTLEKFTGTGLELACDEFGPPPPDFAALAPHKQSYKADRDAKGQYQLEHVHNGGIIALWPEEENDRFLWAACTAQQLVERIVKAIQLREEQGQLEELKLLFTELVKRKVPERQATEKDLYAAIGEAKDLSLFKKMVEVFKGTTDTFHHIGPEQLMIYLDNFGFAEVRPLLDDVLGVVTSTNLPKKIDFLADICDLVERDWRMSAYQTILSMGNKKLLAKSHVPALIRLIDDVGEEAFRSLVVPELPTPDFQPARPRYVGMKDMPGVWEILILALWSTFPDTARYLLDLGLSTLPIDRSTSSAFIALVKLVMPLKLQQSTTYLTAAFLRLDQAFATPELTPTLDEQVKTYTKLKKLFKEHADRGEGAHRMVLSMLEGFKEGIIARAVALNGDGPTRSRGISLAFATMVATAAHTLDADEILVALAERYAAYHRHSHVQDIRQPLCRTVLDLFASRSPLPPAVVKMLQDTLRDYVALIGDEEPTYAFQPLPPLDCNCKVCDGTINPFLLKGDVLELRFTAMQEDRRHVEQLACQRYPLDLALKTEEYGRPYTLVITKASVEAARRWRSKKQERVTAFVKDVAPTEAEFRELFNKADRKEYRRVCGWYTYASA